jgi:hypothetical protein
VRKVNRSARQIGVFKKAARHARALRIGDLAAQIRHRLRMLGEVFVRNVIGEQTTPPRSRKLVSDRRRFAR